MFIVPTIGSVVLFHPTGSRPEEQPMPALIARVWNEGLVNLAAFTSEGVPFSPPATDIPLVQIGDPRPVQADGTYARHCTWMPYQAAQARKGVGFVAVPVT